MRDNADKIGILIMAVLQLMAVNRVTGQDSAAVKPKTDSTYLENYDDWFVIKTSITGTGEALVANTGNYKVILEPNTSKVIRTYFSYQFISFYFDYAPRSLVTNNDDTEKGRTKLFNLGGNLNTRHWFGELNFTKTKGYFIENTLDFRPDWKEGDAYLQVPDLHVTSFDVSIGYNTNASLSLPAAASQTERQLKSTGGFLPLVGAHYYIIDDRTPASMTTQKSKNIQLLAGLGYQYNFVLNRLLYVVGAFTPSAGYVFTNVMNRTSEENYSFRQRGPVFQWDGKFGMGYNGRRFFAGTYLTAVATHYRQGQTAAHSGTANVFFQIFAGIRLVAPKFISNAYAKIF